MEVHFTHGDHAHGWPIIQYTQQTDGFGLNVIVGKAIEKELNMTYLWLFGWLVQNQYRYSSRCTLQWIFLQPVAIQVWCDFLDTLPRPNEPFC